MDRYRQMVAAGLGHWFGSNSRCGNL
jgi:hypothetical protein